MTFLDDDFEFYELPYRHNERNYARYIAKKKDIDFAKYQYFPYLISTPYQTVFNQTKNDYEIKVAILVKNKETKRISLDFERFDFKSLLHINCFSKINNLGDVTLFEQLDRKFSTLICEKEIKISDTESMEILTLEEVANRFNILNKDNIYLEPGFKNLEYYLYKENGQNILISAMDILKYFYLYDYQDNLKSHFLNNILTPNGINSCFNYLNIKGNHYEFEINGDYSISDRYKMLFFITNQKRLAMYSSVFNEFRTNNKISAKIPRKSLSLKVRALESKSQNLILVLNIIKHDHDKNKEFPNNPTFKYIHAKSKYREKDEGKRDKSKDIKKKKVSNDSLDFNDEMYSNDQLEYDDETRDTFQLNIESNKIDVKVDLKGTKEINDQRKQQGGKTIHEDDGEAVITSKRGAGRKDKAVSNIGEDSENKNNASKITINEVKSYIQEKADFKLLDHKNYIYPKVFDDKGKEKKTSFIFIDKNQKIKRKYDIVKVKYGMYFLYIVELQTKLNGTTKSILTLIDDSNILNITSVNDYYIEAELTDFVKSKDRSWFSGRLSLDEIKYFTFRPSGSMEGYTNKLKKHIEKSFPHHKV